MGLSSAEKTNAAFLLECNGNAGAGHAAPSGPPLALLRVTSSAPNLTCTPPPVSSSLRLPLIEGVGRPREWSFSEAYWGESGVR